MGIVVFISAMLMTSLSFSKNKASINEISESFEIKTMDLILNSTLEDCVQFGLNISTAPDFTSISGGMSLSKKESVLKSYRRSTSAAH